MWLSLDCRASSPILIPLSRWVPFSLLTREGLPRSRALFFLLCDCVMSRGLLNKGAGNVQSAA